MTLQEQYTQIIRATVPVHYLYATLGALKEDVSGITRLPAEIQQHLYEKMRANPLAGYAFFAPAGFSKTTCSYALYRRAVTENLNIWAQGDPNGVGRVDFRPDPSAHGDTRFKLSTPRIFAWRKSVPDLIQQIKDRFNMAEGEDALFVPKPDICVEKIEEGVRNGFVPRVFLEEIDKIKASEWAINELERIIDALARHHGQLVLDTNFSKAQFRNVFGDPMARRIKESCDMWEFGF